MQVVAMNMQLVQEGVDRAVASYSEQVLAACMEAVLRTAMEIEEESQSLAPVGTGRLRASARSAGPWRAGMSAMAEAGYAAEYAAQAHEDMEARHPKFLERAVLSVGPRLRQHVTKGLK